MKYCRLTEQINPSSRFDVRFQTFLRHLSRHIVPSIPPDPPDTRLIISRTNREDDNQPTPTPSEQRNEVS